jgi:predicted nucleic-acid-binding protein
VIAIDTNVLIRFLTNDDPAQSRRARRLVAHAVASGETVYISDIVLCETVWVLDRRYGLGRPLLAHVLRSLIGASNVAFSSADHVRAALDAFEDGRGDFSDYLICEQTAAAGSRAVFTFDKNLLKENGFLAP